MGRESVWVIVYNSIKVNWGQGVDWHQGIGRLIAENKLGRYVGSDLGLRAVLLYDFIQLSGV